MKIYCLFCKVVFCISLFGFSFQSFADESYIVAGENDYLPPFNTTLINFDWYDNVVEGVAYFSFELASTVLERPWEWVRENLYSDMQSWESINEYLTDALDEAIKDAAYEKIVEVMEEQGISADFTQYTLDELIELNSSAVNPVMNVVDDMAKDFTPLYMHPPTPKGGLTAIYSPRYEAVAVGFKQQAFEAQCRVGSESHQVIDTVWVEEPCYPIADSDYYWYSQGFCAYWAGGVCYQQICADWQTVSSTVTVDQYKKYSYEADYEVWKVIRDGSRNIVSEFLLEEFESWFDTKNDGDAYRLPDINAVVLDSVYANSNDDQYVSYKLKVKTRSIPNCDKQNNLSSSYSETIEVDENRNGIPDFVPNYIFYRDEIVKASLPVVTYITVN